MPSYIHVPTQRYPLRERHIKTENPNVSFPDIFSPPDEYAEVVVTEKPEHDPLTERLKEDKPILDNGVWIQQWSIVQLTSEEIERLNDDAATNVRAQRDQLLKESDWVSIRSNDLGEPVPDYWITYRQSLRDITAQEGFPHSVEWPLKP